MMLGEVLGLKQGARWIRTGSLVQRVALGSLSQCKCLHGPVGVGCERLADMRKAIDESTHNGRWDCFTRLASVKMERSRRDILVYSPKYQVGDHGETAVHNDAKEKRFRS